MTPLSDNCSTGKSTAYIQQLNAGTFAEERFMLIVSSDIQFMDTIVLRIEINENNFLTYSGIKKIIVGDTEELFYENFESDLSQWNTEGWETTSQDMQGGFQAIVDSKNGSYSSNDNSILLINSVVDLTETKSPMALFDAKWSFAPFDGANLLASSDNVNWDTLAVFINHQHWSQQIIDLSPYIEEAINLKFQIYSDDYVQSDGLYVDDFIILDYTDEVNPEEDLNDQDRLIVFPNPTSDILNIISRVNTEAQIEIFDLKGNLIYNDKLEGFYHRLSLSEYGTGLYLVKITEDYKISSFKVICN